MAEPNGPASKAELLAAMREGRATWDALVARIPDDVVCERVLANGWSVKDLIAHVAAYEQWTAAQIAAASAGRSPTNVEMYGVAELPAAERAQDTDAINAMIHDLRRDDALSDVRALSERAFADLVAAIDGASEAELSRPAEWAGGRTVLAMTPEQSYRHYEQHVPDVRSLVGDDLI